MPGRAEAALQAVLVLEALLHRVAARSARASPSTVVTSWPSAWTASIVQLLTGLPSKSTVQAPQLVVSQPVWVPVSPRPWRSRWASSSRGSTSAVALLAVDRDRDPPYVGTSPAAGLADLLEQAGHVRPPSPSVVDAGQDRARRTCARCAACSRRCRGGRSAAGRPAAARSAAWPMVSAVERPARPAPRPASVASMVGAADAGQRDAGPGDRAARQLEGHRGARRGEVADPALQLEVAAGDRALAAPGSPPRRRSRRRRSAFWNGPVTNSRDRDRAPAARPLRDHVAAERGDDRRPSRPAGRRGTASRPACRGCARSGRRSAAPPRPWSAACAGSSVERSRSACRHSAPTRMRAVGVDPVVVEAGQVVDVDQQLGRGEAQLQQRHQALAAGEHLGLAAALGSRRDRLVDASAAPRSGTGTGYTAGLLLSPRVSGVGPGRPASGSGTATGIDSASGSGRGSWCGGHGPCTGWAATFRYSTSCGPGPDRGALPGLRRVLDQLVQARVALAVPARFDRHDGRLSSDSRPRHGMAATCTCAPHVLRFAMALASKRPIKYGLRCVVVANRSTES